MAGRATDRVDEDEAAAAFGGAVADSWLQPASQIAAMIDRIDNCFIE
jgi:hypothetical protein